MYWKLYFAVIVLSFCSLSTGAQVKKAQTKTKAQPATKAPVKKVAIDTQVAKYSIPSRTYETVDSALRKWTLVDTGTIEYPWHISISAGGKIIALLKDPARQQRVVVLENGKWKPFQDGITDTPTRIITDDVGGVYIPTRHNLYKLTSQGWQQLACPDVQVSGLVVGGRDGNLYAIRKKTSDFAKGAEIVVWKNNCWAPAGPDGKELITPGLEFSNFAVDSHGNIFCWENIPYGATGYTQSVQLWSGGKWQKIAQPDIKIYDHGIDSKDRFFAYGFRDDYGHKGRFFSYWDGSNWGNAPYPPETNNTLGVSITSNNAGKLFIEAYPAASGEHDYRLFALEGDLYVRKAEEDKDFHRDFYMIPMGDAVYAIDQKTHQLFKYSAGYTVKKASFTTIPVALGVEATDAVNAALKSVFLFDENGKKGLKNADGGIIVRPVFDEIVIAAAPTTPPVVDGVTAIPMFHDQAAICLIAGSEKTYVNLRTISYSLRGFWETPPIKCPKCNGAGKGKDQRKQIEVKGEWVEGKTHTSSSSNYERVWNSRTNSYDGVRTTTSKSTTDPGYRKPSTYRTEIIPGETCAACNGKGSYTKEEHYRFDNASNKYIAYWDR